MGHIGKTPAGTYQANWRDPAGIKKSKTFRTRKQAVAFLAETEAALHRGSYVDPHAGRVTFREFVARWRVGHMVSARSEERIVSVLRTHLLPRWERWPMGKIDHLEIQTWVNQLGDSVAPGTVRKAFGVLSQVMQAAVRTRVLISNPCEGVRIAGGRAGGLRTITPEQFLTQLVPAVPATHQALVATAGGTGLRWGELAGLAWGSIDLDKKTVTVKQVVVETAANVTVRPFPKTAASVRTVPLPAFVVDRLLQARSTLDTEPSESALVFGTQHGSPLRRSNFRRQVWRPALVRAGLLGRIVRKDEHRFMAYWLDGEGVEWSAEFTTERDAVDHIAVRAAGGLRFHDLRHAYATWLVLDGLPVNVVQRVMGHRKATTTLNLYTHAPTDYDERVRKAFTEPAEFSPSFDLQDGAQDDESDEEGDAEQEV